MSLSSASREKAKWARVKRVYGLTKEDYDALNTGICPICLRAFNALVKPVVDHDHASGQVRGILCVYCNNRVVGRHRDADLIRRVADYLAKPHTGFTVPPKKRRTKRKKKVNRS